MKNIGELSLTELIPQRPPFVMIDRLVSCNLVKTVTELTVRQDNMFFENNRLSTSGLIENIAQTCAARMGYLNLENGKSVKIGVIGAISNLNINRTPAEGEHLVTTIEVLQEVFSMVLVDAKIECGAKEIVRAQMKIALTDIDSQD